VFLEGVILASIPENVRTLHGDVEDYEAAGSGSKVHAALHILILTEHQLSFLRVVQTLEQESPK